MRRRRLLGLLGGAAVAWPISSSAQQSQQPRRIGFVHSGIPVGKLTETGGTFWIRRFYEELRRLGRVEGSDLIVERFSAEGRTGDFDALAAKVVSTRPDVIVMNNNFLVKAFVRATANIPIVAITGNPLQPDWSRASRVQAATSRASASTQALASLPSACRSSRK